MSKHTYVCTTPSGRTVRVAAGYDRRLDEVFLQVHDETEGNEVEDDEHAIFFFAPPGWRDVTLIAETLQSLAVPVPESFIPGIADDQRRHAGNRIVQHRLGGEPTLLLAG